MATLDQADRTAVVVGVSELWHGVHMGRASSHHTTTWNKYSKLTDPEMFQKRVSLYINKHSVHMTTFILYRVNEKLKFVMKNKELQYYNNT